MRVFDSIQQKEEGRLSLFLGNRKELRKLRIGKCCQIGNHSLVQLSRADFIKSRLLNKVDYRILFFRFP